MWILKYDYFCDECREYGLKENFDSYEEVINAYDNCRKNENCYNIEIVDMNF